MTLSLALENRTTTGRKTDALRAEDIVPGIVYGFEIEPTMVKFNRGDFIRLYREAGTSSVVELELDGKTIHALIHDLQKDPITDFFTHVDFLSVNMKQKVEAEIGISLVGESAAVKANGTLLQTLATVHVEALPNKLVKEIEVDIAKLETFDDSLTIADITAPEGVEFLTDKETVIATVQPPRTEEEMEELDAPVEDTVAAQQEQMDKEQDSESSDDSEENAE